MKAYHGHFDNAVAKPGMFFGLSLFILLVTCGIALVPLRADSGSHDSLYSYSGRPTKRDSGWINLPILTGIATLKADVAKVAFEEFRSLSMELEKIGQHVDVDSDFILEGKDAYMAAALVTKGNPQIEIYNLGSAYQAIFSGPFHARIEPSLIGPKDNFIGLFLPSSFKGGVLKLSAPGLKDQYLLVVGNHLLLSWVDMTKLAQKGIDRVEIEGYTSLGARLTMALECTVGRNTLYVELGNQEE